MKLKLPRGFCAVLIDHRQDVFSRRFKAIIEDINPVIDRLINDEYGINDHGALNWIDDQFKANSHLVRVDRYTQLRTPYLVQWECFFLVMIHAASYFSKEVVDEWKHGTKPEPGKKGKPGVKLLTDSRDGKLKQIAAAAKKLDRLIEETQINALGFEVVIKKLNNPSGKQFIKELSNLDPDFDIDYGPTGKLKLSQNHNINLFFDAVVDGLRYEISRDRLPKQILSLSINHWRDIASVLLDDEKGKISTERIKENLARLSVI